jgi:hypothetical protein
MHYTKLIRTNTTASQVQTVEPAIETIDEEDVEEIVDVEEDEIESIDEDDVIHTDDEAQQFAMEQINRHVSQLQSEIDILKKDNQQLTETLDKLRSENDELEKKLEVANKTILKDYDVEEIMESLKYFSETYFEKEGVELEKDIPFNPRFIYNLPAAVAKGIRHAKNNDDVPDVLNPAVLLYLLMAKEPYDSIELWWKIVLDELVDGNREAIDEGAQSRLADLNIEEEDDYE